MNKVFKTFGLVLLTVCSNIQTSAQVSEFHPGTTANGVTYALPKTVLKLQAEALRTEYRPGEFARYAERCLHIQNVRQEAEVRYQLSRVQMVAFGEPDTNKVFTVAYNAKTTAPLVRLSPEGVLLAINSDEKVTLPSLPEVKHLQTNHALDNKRYLTEEILAATSTIKMAELTAAEIYDLRESRNALLRGEAENQPTDGEALRLRLEGLKQQEDALMQMFVGYTDTVSVTQIYEVNPVHAEKEHILFRFSSHYGFVDADDLSGEPVKLQVVNQHTVALPTEKDLQKRKLTGIVYNLPGKAKVSLSGMGTVWLNKDVPIAQFGTDDQLSRELFIKGVTTRVTFSPSTGGILHVSN